MERFPNGWNSGKKGAAAAAVGDDDIVVRAEAKVKCPITKQVCSEFIPARLDTLIKKINK
jgi:hypothetical protein